MPAPRITIPTGVSTANTNSVRRLDIQGLRAVAVLMVVAFHCGLPVPGGFVGVDVFFVISGFVITGMLRREWAATGRIRFGRFYLRRFKRLTPALALTVCATVLVSAVVLSPLGTQQIAAKTGVGAILLIANVVISRATGGYFDGPAEANPLLNTWSLSVEEQFYLAFPAMVTLGLLVARRRDAFRAAPYVLIGATAAGSFGLAVLTSTGWAFPLAPWLLGFYSPFTRAWEFAVGSLLALALTRRTMRSHTASGWLGLLGAAMLATSLWTISEMTPFPGVWTLLPVSGTLLLLLAGSRGDNPVSRVLASPFGVRVGDWSYSIYLWHWPMIVFAAALWPGHSTATFLAAALSLAPALASFHWVEEPIRSLRNLGRLRLATLMTATLFPPLALSVGLWFSAANGFWSRPIHDFQAAVSAVHDPTTRGCMSTGPFTSEPGGSCQWNAGAPGLPIYLVGDSHAWHFAEAAIGAGEELDRPVWISAAPSCPFIDGLDIEMVSDSQFFPRRVRSSEFDHCPGYTTAALDWLRQSQEGVVLIAALDQYWWDPAIGAALAEATPINDPAAKAALFATGLKSTVETLERAGHQVVLVATVPTYQNPTPIWDPTLCTAPTITAGRCERRVPVATIDRIQSTTRGAMQQVAAETNAMILDPRESFCDSQECSTSRDGVTLYQDATHLTVAASAALAPKFAAAVKAAG